MEHTLGTFLFERHTAERLPGMVRRILALATMAVLAAPMTAQTALDVRFGILIEADDGTAEFIETTRVPNVIGQAYGWIAALEPSSESVVWNEELKLPRSARVWPETAGNPNLAVNEDRTIAHSRGVVLPGEAEFSHFWSVAPSDPSGEYSLVVKVSDGVVAAFTFNVVDTR